MDWQHPAFQEMMNLGCSNRLNITLTFQTYMNLCEVKKLWDVNYFYMKDLDLIYLAAKEKKKDERLLLYLTISVNDSVKPTWLCTVQKILNQLHPNSEFNLVIKAPDSTMLQYTLTQGLIPPLSPEAAKENKTLLEKEQFLRSEFNKMKHKLYDEVKQRKTNLQNDCTMAS